MQIHRVEQNRVCIIKNSFDSGECAQLNPLDRFQDWGLWEDSTFIFGESVFSSSSIYWITIEENVITNVMATFKWLTKARLHLLETDL